MKKILCVGHSAYDITYLLPNFPIENRKYKAQDRIMVSGGPAGNAAYLLGKIWRRGFIYNNSWK